ncbi:PepSY domain-containing protein [Pseudomonas aeruginosa]|uniref:PepSY-associated TM helix domain-containing protein n=1 Tax=Pseudomonas aeruginosa TaxID=287 RepID=UPI001AD9A9EA|nr:PepSY domain-containing protein [Pseudomonas aeruginosa]MBO8294533.1 PepSY domain-containing protein [Pseudomonas aeruginosa]MBT1116049.1 PepSY domain-containing protein [Pseudomonas aeruginosa]MCJ1942323.1 PepSY domain-containing protein [Pseudomonas aeruginosa]HCF4067590.1 PepSY domain-containing protein [Pseudomonas aeruginosa]HCF4170152.1 PepSY domain-containing protein [Pseudomonas aeruginosa]
MTAKTLRTWYLVHKWTSLISTIFLLMLCLTGLPLIFHEEIEHYFEPHPQLEPLTAESPRIDYDDVIARALAARPGEVVRFLVFEKDDPLGLVISAPSLVPPPENGHMQPFDARTGEFFDALPPPGGFMYLMLKLHTDLFLGLPGYLFLGLMGLLLVASLVSGVVVYTPFMRKLDFATVRRAAPDMEVSFVGFPGTQFSSQHHYAVFMRGNTPLTERLLKPALIDAQSGELTDMREMPLYVKTLLLSQPLHFGDYGGMPLKIVWALLDLVSIVILASGLYLWLGRRKTPLEKRLAELPDGSLATEGKA